MKDNKGEHSQSLLVASVYSHVAIAVTNNNTTNNNYLYSTVYILMQLKMF